MAQVVGVVFQPGGKVYTFDAAGLELRWDEKVICQTARGRELGRVVEATHMLPDEELTSPLKKVLRRAGPADDEQVRQNRVDAKRAMLVFREMSRRHGLALKRRERPRRQGATLGDRCPGGHFACRFLIAVLGRPDFQSFRHRRSELLLNSVRQLVHQKPHPLCRPRRILAGAEHHVPPYCVSKRIHRLRRLRGFCIGMHPHPAEIVPEEWLHKSARRRIERVAGRMQRLLHDGRSHIPRRWLNGGALQQVRTNRRPGFRRPERFILESLHGRRRFARVVSKVSRFHKAAKPQPNPLVLG